MEAGDVPELEKCRLGDGFDVGVEGEGWVKQDPEISYKEGGADGTAVNGEDEVVPFSGGWAWER